MMRERGNTISSFGKREEAAFFKREKEDTSLISAGAPGMMFTVAVARSDLAVSSEISVTLCQRKERISAESARIVPSRSHSDGMQL